jgi:hypothetical protein
MSETVPMQETHAENTENTENTQNTENVENTDKNSLTFNPSYLANRNRTVGNRAVCRNDKCSKLMNYAFVKASKFFGLEFSQELQVCSFYHPRADFTNKNFVTVLASRLQKAHRRHFSIIEQDYEFTLDGQKRTGQRWVIQMGTPVVVEGFTVVGQRSTPAPAVRRGFGNRGKRVRFNKNE